MKLAVDHSTTSILSNRKDLGWQWRVTITLKRSAPSFARKRLFSRNELVGALYREGAQKGAVAEVKSRKTKLERYKVCGRLKGSKIANDVRTRSHPKSLGLRRGPKLWSLNRIESY